ncbi:MAG: acyl-CoA dehydrogenase [Alphaproteobacteria bacterium]|nr:acyl-CoA dehydrogenase [Alphaproteobacteria bacterium]
MHIIDRIDLRRSWTGEEVFVLDQVRRLIRETIAPAARETDLSGRFPWANVEAINALGLNGIYIPETYGGAPMSYRVYLAVVKLIASACASTGIIYATNFHATGPIVDFATEEQKARFLPRIATGGLAALAITESEAGSDATGMRTIFRPQGDTIVVSGSKAFITSGDVADIILVFGKWAETENPRAAISALVLEKGTEGFEIAHIEDKMGHRGSTTAAMTFNDCRVPRDNLIGAPGDGLAILLASLNRSRPSIAAHALGIARAAFDDMVTYMNSRQQSGRRIIDFQGNQFMLADRAADLAMAEVWLDHVAALIDAAERDFGVEASIAKLRASDLAMLMATDAVQMHGGYGYCRDFRVERLMRDAKITQIWEGTNQIQRQLIGRSFAAK